MIVDSTVWIHFLRTPITPVGQEMKRLLENGEVGVVGVVLAEVLQGARGEREYSRLLPLIGAQTYVEDGKQTWIRVGELSLQLKARGRLVPITDLAIAAVALEDDLEVYTLDDHFQRIPGLRLHQAGEEDRQG